jgi:hypothetical protein
MHKILSASVVFTNPHMEIFQSSYQEGHSEVDTMMNYDNGIFYARVFLLEELNAIYEMLTACEGVVVLSTGNSLVSALKSSVSNIFVKKAYIEREVSIGKPGMVASIVEHLLWNHMARHIMEGKGWGGDVVPAEPCGWCGGGECSVKNIGATKNAKVQVECKRFHNLKLAQFSLAMARKKTSKFPSTNHPLLCPGGCKSYIWSYNIIQHLLHSIVYSGRVSIENEQVKQHLPFLDELDPRVEKKNTEKERLWLLFKNSNDYFKCVQHTGQNPETHHTTPSHRDWVTIDYKHTSQSIRSTLGIGIYQYVHTGPLGGNRTHDPRLTISDPNHSTRGIMVVI